MGIAALAIDGPFHGERVTSPLAPSKYQHLIHVEGIEAVTDRMTSDCSGAIAAVDALGFVDTTQLGYLGLYLGTRFSLPLCVAVGGALRYAVFGKFGLRHATGFYDGSDMTELIRATTRQNTAPTLFHLQWDDELFPREGQLELFDLLGSTEKQLIAYGGKHGDTSPQATPVWSGFVARRLRPHISPLDPIIDQ